MICSYVSLKTIKFPVSDITENGAAFSDQLSEDGRVNDEQRINFYSAYLQSAHKAIEDGVPLHGYFAFSLIDNFEWAEGYSKRFGLIYIDYPTQRRIMKESGFWYRDSIAANGLV